MTRAVYALLAVFVFAGSAAAAQSLAEAAKQAEEQHAKAIKDQKKADAKGGDSTGTSSGTKVYTNKDLKPAPAPIHDDSTAAASPDSDATTPGEPTKEK